MGKTATPYRPSRSPGNAISAAGRPLSMHAEFVALDIGHGYEVLAALAARPLRSATEAAQFGHQRVDPLDPTSGRVIRKRRLNVEMQAVLDGFGFRHPQETQPLRPLRVVDRGKADPFVLREPLTYLVVHPIVVVVRNRVDPVVQGRRPEGGHSIRIVAVDDNLKLSRHDREGA